jgi:AAA domain-containing protein
MSVATIPTPALGVDAWPRLARVVRQLATLQIVHESDDADRWLTVCPLHPHSGNDLFVTPDFAGRAILDCARHCDAVAIAHAAGADPRDVVAPPVPPEAPVGLPRAVRAIDAPEPEPITWCVEELLIAGEIAVFAGDGGSFKSSAGFHIAGAVAGGYAVFNRFPTRARPTLILSAEDSAGVVLNRLEALVDGHGWDRERVLSNVHIIASHEAKLSNPAWQQHLLTEALRLNVGYVQCDPLFDLVEGDENSNTELRPVISFTRKLATATGAAVVIVHHASKVKPDQRTIDRVRGASALRDASRCLLFFESRPEGIAIEHLKMSRSERLSPFMVTREIESSPDSRAIWTSARFSFQSTEDAVLSRVESFLLDQIAAAPGTLKSGDLRHRGGLEGIRGEDVSKGISHLQSRGLIDFALGPRNSKFWSPVEHSRENCPQTDTDQNSWTDSGRLENEPVHPARSRSGRLEATTSEATEPAPLKGGWQARSPIGAGQAGLTRFDTPDDPDVPEEFDL